MGLLIATRRPLMPAPNRIREGLVASYRLGEGSDTRFDSVSPGIGPAAQFVAANSEYLSRADNADLSTGDIDFSVAAWVRFDTITGVPVILSKWEDSVSDNREYVIQLVTSRFDFGVNSTGAAAQNVVLTADTFGDVSADTWYFVVVYHDSVNNRIGISVNDVADTAAHTAGVYDSTAAFLIGAMRPSVPVNYLNGRVQCVGFWKKVLSTAEITSLYNAGRGLAYRDLSGSLLTSLTEWWAHSEPAGTRIGSVGANNLTDNNTVTQAVGVQSSNSLGVAGNPGNAAGRIGNALVLASASSQFAQMPAALFGSGQWSVDGWIYPTSLVGNDEWWSQGTASAVNQYVRVLSTGIVEASANGGTTTSVSTTTLEINTWYHLALVYDGTNQRLYVNGVQEDSDAVTPVYTGGNRVVLGANAQASAFSNGRVDAVNVWTRALTAAEVAAQYAGGNGREYPMAA